MEAGDDLDDSFQISLGEIRAGRQAQTALEERFGDGAAHMLAAGKDRLQVHGLPYRACLDVGRFQRAADLFAIGTVGNRIDGNAGQPARVPALGRLRHEADAR